MLNDCLKRKIGNGSRYGGSFDTARLLRYMCDITKDLNKIITGYELSDKVYRTYLLAV